MDQNQYDTIIESLGSMGSYQIMVFVLVSLFETPAAWAILLPIFTDITPDWWCLPPELLNITSTTPINTSSISQHYKSCTIGEMRCENFIFADGLQTTVTQFELVCHNEYQKAIVPSIQMFGLAVGATFSGQAADMFGRKKVLFFWYVLLLIAELISAFSPVWIMYATVRFFVGTGIGGLLVVNFILPIEYVGRSWRTFCGCIGFWAAGIMTLPLIAYFIRDWRYLCIFTSLAGLPLLVTWWWIPESARWLVTRGRYSEAEEILTRIAVTNKRPVPDFQLLRTFAQSQAKLKEQKKKFSYWHLFRSCRAAIHSSILIFGWFVSAFGYYGLSFGLSSLTGDLYLNTFLSGLIEWPALIYVLLINNRIGRRWCVFSLFSLAAIALVSILFVDLFATEGQVKQNTILVLALIGKSGITGGWAAIQVLSAESFPTLIRNLGIASCSVGARVAGVLAPLMKHVVNVFPQGPFVASGILAVALSILVLFITETSDQPLPDYIDDNNGLAVGIEPNQWETVENEGAFPLIEQSCNKNDRDKYVDFELVSQNPEMAESQRINEADV